MFPASSHLFHPFESESDVHVHLFSLSEIAGWVPEQVAMELLTREERVEVSSMKAPGRRREFLYGRIMLRSILAAYAGTALDSILVTADERGKPRAVGTGETPLPAFNVSHTADLLAVAISPSGEVGVDVEGAEGKKISALEGISRRYFSEDEHEFLMAQPAGLRLSEFLRMWTLKESMCKAVGMGLSQPLHTLHVRLPSKRYLLPLHHEGRQVSMEAEHFRLQGKSDLAVARLVRLGTVRLFPGQQT